MERRTVLAGMGLTSVGYLAGCLDLDGNDREGVLLTEVELVNITGEPQTFSLQVEYEGEVIYDDDHEVGVGDGEHGEERQLVDIDTPPDPGVFSLHAEVDGHTRSADVDGDISNEEYDGERVIVDFTFVRRGDQDEPTFTHGVRPADRD